eukprot:12413638-Karenia_brevis.AAC.1
MCIRDRSRAGAQRETGAGQRTYVAVSFGRAEAFCWIGGPECRRVSKWAQPIQCAALGMHWVVAARCTGAWACN